ncbi:MAG TPA: ParB N-terminal domain-containing protein [Candidatus Angelobacter sp.]|jgi:ParB/RepB/Spo0J family partition protein|nr:ParB N-terminal domain-containing protein [Candidatus Angelobacter sp.]
MSTTTIPDAAEAPAVPETAVVPLASIRAGANVREDFGDIEGLAEKIRTTGLLQGLVVCRTDDGGYDLIAGGRRYRAAQLANCDTVPVIIRPRPSDRVRIELQLIENNDRLDLSVPELFGAVQELLDLGAGDAELGATLGSSADEAATLRSVVGLGPAVHELIVSGHLSVGDAAPLTELAGLGTPCVEHAVARIHQGFAPAIAVRHAKDKHRRDQVVADATALATSRKLRLVEAPQFGAFEHGGSTKRLGKAYGCVDVPAKEHSKLPCHAAYIDSDATNVKAAIVLVCTNAKSHRPAPTPVIGAATPSSVDLSPGQKAVATKRHRKAWRETHGPRSAAITGIVADLNLDEAMGRVASHVLQEHGFSSDAYVAAARLLVGSDAVPGSIRDAKGLVLERARQSGEAAVRVALAVLTARAEHAFQEPRGVHDERLNVQDHFGLLARHEYPVKDAEIDHLRIEYQLPSPLDAGSTPTAFPVDDDDIDSDDELDTASDRDGADDESIEDHAAADAA